MRSRTRPTTGVFLDRDDTIIRDRVYLSDPDGVEILPGAAEAIQTLNRKGIPVIMVTNQSGIARGIFDMDALNRIHHRLTALMAQRDARIDAIYFCPHHPEGTREEYRVSCSCRKPEPGMLREAAEAFGLDLVLCYMVGDKPDDIEAIHRVGGKGILINTGTGIAMAVKPEFVARDMPDAVRWILEDMQR